MKRRTYLFSTITLVVTFAVWFTSFSQLSFSATNDTISALTTTSPATILLKSEMAKSATIEKAFMKSPQSLPFTFVLNKKKIRGIPTSWKPKTVVVRTNPNLTKTTIIGTEPATKLKATFELTSYKDFPALEWIVWFEANGKTKTKIIRDIKVMDYKLEGASPELTECSGDFNSPYGYLVTKTKLSSRSVYYSPSLGRPSDSAFPYYRLSFKDYGITLAIGWPCQWSAVFTGTSKGASITCGQDTIETYLNSGEKIRSPRMTMLTFKSGEANAINLWRSWYRKYILIKPDGKEIQPFYSASGTDVGEEFTAATETNQLTYIDKFNKLGYNFDVWWIDAGWYPCFDQTEKMNKWYDVGDWRPDPSRFPNGIKPISDKLHSNNQKLLLWFEPERVFYGTPIAKLHPEWVLKNPEDPTAKRADLLNMGNPRCRLYLTNLIDKQIKQNGVDIYRQDYNLYGPLNRIQTLDKPGRVGIAENFYVQGYLQFWDDLLARNPGLIIDSCAGGGRRNDLETMRRSVPLHYSDYGYGLTVIKQGFQNTLYQWFPYFKDISLSVEYDAANSLLDKDHQLDPINDVDPFAAYAGMSPFFCSTVDIKNDSFDFTTNLKFKSLWEKASKYLVDSDYYLLTPNTTTTKIWTVRQFDIPKAGDGIFQLFRNIDNKQETYVIHPKGSINASSTYELTNLYDGTITEISGQEWLTNGYQVSLGAREACILKYSIINK